jgi:autotransporter passenger strand-loop-strand repeat protein
LSGFTAGDLVISLVGDVANNGTYTLDQASPIFLQELTTSGTIVGTMVLPQETTVVNGVTEYGISGEYGSASEGALQLSGDGQSLVIMGYGVNADAFNTGTIYGTNALGQTTSIPGGTVTAVPRVVADINYAGTVDTSTALYNVFNTNNPRSVTTVNGTTFYLSGQGVKGDTTQGVFFAHDGATSATAIDTSTDTRFVSIQNGQLYVSRDSTQSATGGTNIATYGTTLPTGKTAPSVLPGISESVTLTAAEENTVNAGAVGTSVNLSPENFFFASSTVLYVADGGVPKNGGIGDGGLQKWVYNGTTWQLEYTLSQGLNLVNSTTATSGTSGLIGLTGTVVGGNVYLYATTETVGETDQSYLYSIADTLNSTTGAGESFTQLMAAPADTIIRGISFAPTQATSTPTVTSVTAATTSSGLTVTSGSSLSVMSGGTVVSTTVLSGGTMVVSAGGFDSGTDIAQGGSETANGSATGDFVGGTQLITVSTAVVTNDVVLNGGTVELFIKGAIANSPTVDAGGTLLISGNATVNNGVISGGLIELQSPKAVLAGSVTFDGTGTIEVTSNTSPTSSGVSYGDLAVISGFGTGDVIDLTSNTSVGKAGAAATLSTTTSGGNTVAMVSGGGSVETYIFAGTAIGSFLSLGSDNNGGEELTFSAPPPTSTTVPNTSTSTGLAVASGSFVDVLSGGTLADATLFTGGSATVEIGGVDSGSTIGAGGNELVFGSATGDAISGTQLLSAPTSASSSVAVVSNETVFNGGAVELFLKGAVANNVTVDAGGTLAINGFAVASNTVLNGGVVELESGKATLSGGLTFETASTLEITSLVSATTSSGELAVISNFTSGDAVDYTFMGPGATLSTTVSGGNTVATVTSNGTVQTAIFAGSVTSNLTLTGDGSGGEEIVYTSSAVTSSSTATSVTSGLTDTGLVVSGGMTLDVLAGGTIVSASVLSIGSVTVQSGGVDSGSTISAGGTETDFGSATLDQIQGTQFIDGTVSGETILSNGTVTVEASGIDSGSVISAGGNETVTNSATGDQVYGTQAITVSGAAASNETVFNGGNVELLIAGAIANGITVETGGQITISGRGTLEAGVLSGGSLLLESPKATISGTLTFDGPATLEETATISPVSAGILFGDQAVNVGFGAGDVIEFTGATSVGAAGSAATLSITTSGGNTVATVSGNGSVEPFIFAGTTIAGSLSLVTSGGVVELVACFAAGTRIATTQGEIAVENLRVGDMVPTMLGRAAAPIIWIGQREVDCTRHPKPKQVWPVRITAGAFGPGMPHTDLVLSPDHAVYVGEVLIPVKRLINGSTIVQVPVDRVTYYHIELPRHDVVLAEGLPAESFLDMKDGSNYAKTHGVVALQPDFSSRMWEAFGCAPLVVTGPEFEVARDLVESFAASREAA